MKKIMTLCMAVTMFSGAAQAQDLIPGEFSANVALTSEYAFRGISQSDEGPAVQGGIDWSHESGFYAGVWASSVEFTDASIETDIYGGYAGELANGLTYDIGAIYYLYPGADNRYDYDFVEAAFALGYDFDVAALSASVNYSPDYFANSGHAFYTAAYLDVPLSFLPFDTTLSANIGHQTIEDEARFGITEDSYIDYGIGLTANVEGFDVSLKYVDTNLDEPSECADNCDSRVIVSISKSFP